MSAPITPQPSSATLPEQQLAPTQTLQSSNMTPPSSTQVPSSSVRTKSRTPTPTYSHISTPPPTIETSSQAAAGRPNSAYARDMTTDQIASASADELRAKVAEFQAAYQEANMSAAHHKLQYRMLAQESAAAIERMAVEARMAQYENEVIHIAEQAKAAVPNPPPSTLHNDGTIRVQKDLYQRMCCEIKQLTENQSSLEASHRQQERVIARQETELASLSDKVTLLRDRIRENRAHQNRARSASQSRPVDHPPNNTTPRSIYSTPRRRAPQTDDRSAQPFAALLQASEMASSQETASRNPRGHKRGIHSLSSLPATPLRAPAPPLFQTPQPRRAHHLQAPATAPAARHLSSQDVYARPRLPVAHIPGPASDGTVSASENENEGEEYVNEDSEAETEILDPEAHAATESQASRAASQMLRASGDRAGSAQRSFQGRGMLGSQRGEARGRGESGGGGMRQGKLFGAVRKSGVGREEERVSKKARVGEGVGLGIAGVRQ